MTDFKKLFADVDLTVSDIETIEALEKHGSRRKAARALGLDEKSIRRRLAKLERLAALKGRAPGHFIAGVAPGFIMGKVTVQRDETGAVERTWERQSPDSAAREAALRVWVEELSEGIKDMVPATRAPEHCADELLVVYPAGDPHFGLYCWWEDAGEDFDLKIAEEQMTAAVDRLVASAPAAHTGLFLNLGDMFHADNQKNESQSGHKLDVDGRWAKVQQVGLRAKIHCIRRMLEKHAEVIVRINRGNHDGHSAYALALMLSCYFHAEPRVRVDLSPSVLWYHQFGKVLIGSTHGDTIKGPALIGVMAADEPVAWGETTHRYFLVGHVHHKDVKEYPGGIVEYFRTLAARDAWHTGQGYRAGRDMQLIVMHRDFGEVERHRVDVAMLK